MHFLLGLIAFLVICYLVGSTLFKNDPDPDRRFRKGLITTIVLAVVGIGGLIYWMIRNEEHKTRIRECSGYEGKIKDSELVGRWQDENSFIEFKPDHTYKTKWFSGNEESGTWEIDYNILYYTHQNSDLTVTKEAYKFCNFSKNEFICRATDDNNDWTVKRVNN